MSHTQPCFRLAYRDRRYLFTPLGDKRVRVERWEPLNGGLKSDQVYPTGKARWLWNRLQSLGYQW